jgi:hypothetical protein
MDGPTCIFWANLTLFSFAGDSAPHHKPEAIQEALRAYDTDGNSQLDREEFAVALEDLLTDKSLAPEQPGGGQRGVAQQPPPLPPAPWPSTADSVYAPVDDKFWVNQLVDRSDVQQRNRFGDHERLLKFYLMMFRMAQIELATDPIGFTQRFGSYWGNFGPVATDAFTTVNGTLEGYLAQMPLESFPAGWTEAPWQLHPVYLRSV